MPRADFTVCVGGSAAQWFLFPSHLRRERAWNAAKHHHRFILVDTFLLRLHERFVLPLCPLVQLAVWENGTGGKETGLEGTGRLVLVDKRAFAVVILPIWGGLVANLQRSVARSLGHDVVAPLLCCCLVLLSKRDMHFAPALQPISGISRWGLSEPREEDLWVNAAAARRAPPPH